MADTVYRVGDSNYTILKKILRRLDEEFNVSAENKYRENDSINNMLKKVLRIFNDEDLGGGVVEGTTGSFSGNGAPTDDPGMDAAFYWDKVNKVTYAWNDDLDAWE